MVKMGDKNEEVKEIQRRLISEGYNCGPYGADGDFGKGTYDAVIRFQQEVGLEADGIVGPATWAALKACTMDNHPNGMRLGDKGVDVEFMQNLLISKGYSCGESGADGDFGQGTLNAVIAFQKDRGLEADGIVGNKTMSALRLSYTNELLKLGSKGPYVREAQSLLISKGYSCGASGADGDFGQGTWNAVFNFQKDRGLTADGIIGPATWSVLRNGTTSQILKMGARGSSVVLLQNRLISAGYSCGSYGSDGVFGQSTLNAVIAFQRAHGLDPDGVVGPATWAALNGNSAAGRGILRKGSQGEGVRELQRILIALGYSCGAYGADGDFGEGTLNAVIAFQKAHGLDPDGVVGPATWAALNGLNPSYVIPSGSIGVARFLEVARSQLGYHEVGVNWTKYGSWYGCDGNAWCAMFVSWCANQAGILGSIIPSYCLCSNAVSTYRAWGRYRTRISGYIPKPGDVFFLYDSSESVPYCHTGIVEFVEGNTIHTIEGNSSDMVRRCIRNINDWNIDGYGDNGGIKKPSISDAELYKQESNHSFAKLFGITIKGTQEIEIPIPFIWPSITIKYKFTREDKVSSSNKPRVDGIITIKNGKITTDFITPYADTTKIRKLIQNHSISQQLIKLGDCTIDLTVKFVSTACIDIILGQSYKVSDEIKVTQSIEVIYKPTKSENDSSIALEDPNGYSGVICAVASLAFIGILICVTDGTAAPALAPEIERDVEKIVELFENAA